MHIYIFLLYIKLLFFIILCLWKLLPAGIPVQRHPPPPLCQIHSQPTKYPVICCYKDLIYIFIHLYMHVLHIFTYTRPTNQKFLIPLHLLVLSSAPPCFPIFLAAMTTILEEPGLCRVSKKYTVLVGDGDGKGNLTKPHQRFERVLNLGFFLSNHNHCEVAIPWAIFNRMHDDDEDDTYWQVFLLLLAKRVFIVGK